MIDVQNSIDEKLLTAMSVTLIDEVKKLREKGYSWKKITKRVLKDMKERQTVPYVMYHNNKCGHPKGCKELAMIAFLYKEGAIFACIEHYKETEVRWSEYMNEDDE